MILKNSKIFILLLVGGLVFVTGCRPRGVLSKRKMVDVLCDIHYADAVLQVAGLNYGHDEQVAKSYQLVLDKHGVTQAEFDSSMVWYTDHPQRFEKIYPKVLARLEANRDEWLERLGEQEQQQRLRPALKPFSEVEHCWWRLPKARYMSQEDVLGKADSVRYYGVLVGEQADVFEKMQKNIEDTCENEKKVVPLHAFSGVPKKNK